MELTQFPFSEENTVLSELIPELGNLARHLRSYDEDMSTADKKLILEYAVRAVYIAYPDQIKKDLQLSSLKDEQIIEKLLRANEERFHYLLKKLTHRFVTITGNKLC